MDGLREAHMDVLVAVFGQKNLMPQPPDVAVLGKQCQIFDSHRPTR